MRDWRSKYRAFRSTHASSCFFRRYFEQSSSEHLQVRTKTRQAWPPLARPSPCLPRPRKRLRPIHGSMLFSDSSITPTKDRFRWRWACGAYISDHVLQFHASAADLYPSIKHQVCFEKHLVFRYCCRRPRSMCRNMGLRQWSLQLVWLLGTPCIYDVSKIKVLAFKC